LTVDIEIFSKSFSYEMVSFFFVGFLSSEQCVDFKKDFLSIDISYLKKN
jgi:hypothetical protein